MSNFRLDNKLILLTGAAGRFGRAILQGLLDAGAKPIMVGRSMDRLEKAVEACTGEGRDDCRLFECDIADAAERTQLVEWLNEHFDALHGIVNNAYSGRTGHLSTITENDFSDATNMNLVAPFELTRSCLGLLEEANRKTGQTSSVVNISSMYGVVSPDPSVYGDSGKNNPIHYGATKAGMIQMTRYLACHLGNQGIRANSITPGPFPDLAVDPGIPGFYARLADKVPMGRVGNPSEMAGPVIFLLSDAASYVNGANLKVDGGWTAW